MDTSNNIASQLSKAQSLLAQRNPLEAGKLFREILGLKELSVSQRITASNGLGQALFAANDLDGAEAAFSDLLDLLKENFGPEHKNVALGYQNLARVLADKKDALAAIDLGEKALAILKKAADEAPEDKKNAARAQLAGAHFTLSSGYYNAKDWDRAEEQVNAAMALWGELKGAESPEVATCLNNLGRIYEERSQPEKGIELHKKAVDMRRKLLGTHEDTAFSLGNLGTAQAEAGHLKDAIASLTDAVTMYTELGLGEGALAESYKKNLEHCIASAAALKGDGEDSGPIIQVNFGTGCGGGSCGTS